MARSVALATVLVVVAVAMGLYVQQRLFGTPGTPAGPSAPPSQAPAPVPPPANTLTVAAPPPAPPAGLDAGASAGLPPSTVSVLEARGTVESAAEDGPFAPVRPGQALGTQDTVRTGRDGSAVVGAGSARLKLDGRSSVQVGGITEGTVRFKLLEGRVSADVPEDGPTGVELTARGSDAAVEGRGGRFSMMADGLGLVAVANETGSVRLTSRGQTLEVPRGGRGVVRGNGAPRVSTVPGTLLLKVAPPARNVQRETEHVVEGTASADALVRVNGRLVARDAQGRFRLKVPLQDGRNGIEVTATDVDGRTRDDKVSVTVDRAAPAIRGTMTWGGDGTP